MLGPKQRYPYHFTITFLQVLAIGFAAKICVSYRNLYLPAFVNLGWARWIILSTTCTCHLVSKRQLGRVTELIFRTKTEPRWLLGQ